jgi:DNA transposition AAA+ family ATPase
MIYTFEWRMKNGVNVPLLSVAAGEGVQHPLKKFYMLKKWYQKSKKFTKTFLSTKKKKKKKNVVVVEILG